MGKVTIALAVIGKLILFNDWQTNYDSYFYSYLSGYEIILAFFLNAAFNSPALIYVAILIKGNPDLKKLFSRSFLIFPGVVLAIPFIGYIFNRGLSGYFDST